MTRTFDTLPPEILRLREVRLAVEVLDPVSGERIRGGLRVQASGMLGTPIVNAGGMFVWTREPGHEPIDITVDPRELPFEPLTAPAPAAPNQLLSVSLSPRIGYPFSAGVPGILGRLVERRLDDPAQPVTDATVWLQWIDDSSGVATPIDAPIRARTDALGEFVVFVRLAATQMPVTLPPNDPQGRLRVRVAASRAGVVRRSPEQTLRPGRIATPATAFAWDEFQP